MKTKKTTAPAPMTHGPAWVTLGPADYARVQPGHSSCWRCQGTDLRTERVGYYNTEVRFCVDCSKDSVDLDEDGCP